MARRADTGTLEVGRTLPGRGAWLCAGSTACIAQAARTGAFRRALRAEVTTEAVEALRVAIEACARMVGRSHSDNEGK